MMASDWLDWPFLDERHRALHAAHRAAGEQQLGGAAVADDGAAALALAEEWAHKLAAGPAFAHAMTKKLLHQAWAMDLDSEIEAEAQAQAICMQTADFRRAYEAFAAKRAPKFEGN